jgi:flagellar basal-body rod protein FlgB
MFQGIFRSSTIPVLEQVVQFTQARHEVLSGNVANLGTPGYQARDLSVAEFQARLRDAIEARHQTPLALPPGNMAISPGEMGASLRAVGISPGEMAADRSDPVAGAAKDPRSILFHDQSDNAAELQVTEMVKNQMQHNMAMAIMASQFRLLQSVVSERL